MKKPIDVLLEQVEWSELPAASAEVQKVMDDYGNVYGNIPTATHSGVFRLGDMDIKCYRLSDGRAIFDADDINRFFGFMLGETVED